MQTWPEQEAKARFNELLETCLIEGPQIVTQQGTEAAVLIPITLWQQTQPTTQPTLKELLLMDTAREEITIPPRGQARRRVFSE